MAWKTEKIGKNLEQFSATWIPEWNCSEGMDHFATCGVATEGPWHCTVPWEELRPSVFALFLGCPLEGSRYLTQSGSFWHFGFGVRKGRPCAGVGVWKGGTYQARIWCLCCSLCTSRFEFESSFSSKPVPQGLDQPVEQGATGIKAWGWPRKAPAGCGNK